MNKPNWEYQEEAWIDDLVAKRKRRGLLAVSLFAIVLLGCAGAYYYLTEIRTDEAQAAPTAPVNTTPGLSQDLTGSVPTAPANQPTIVTDASGQQVNPDSFVLQLNEDFSFNVSGTVSNQEVADGLTKAATASYGQYANLNSLKVDPAATPNAWEPALPLAAIAVPALVNGTVEITETETIITGSIPDETQLQNLETALSPEAGFPPIRKNLTIIDQAPSSFKIFGTDEKVTFEGVVPSEQVRTALITSAEGQYGEENVTDNLNTDPARYTRFQTIRFGDILRAFRPFGQFEFGLVEDGSFYSILSEGVTFDTGSSQLSERTQALIANLPPLLLRTDLTVQVLGYTDNTGSVEFNNKLSQDRANNVSKIFLEGGVPQERVIAEGKGPTDFIGDNDTEAGKQRNRRVEMNVSRLVQEDQP